jgi:hypothetical protein
MRPLKHPRFIFEANKLSTSQAVELVINALDKIQESKAEDWKYNLIMGLGVDSVNDMSIFIMNEVIAYRCFSANGSIRNA